jgi:AraC-like DNA-binding protein
MSAPMSYRLHAPSEPLAGLVDCYWIIEDANTAVVEQKIIPDGFPEIIFHFGDPYDIRLIDAWQRQARQLVAGQITRYFHLRNTGRSAMAGIKLKPHALAHWFGLQMHGLTDRVLDLHPLLPGRLETLERELGSANDDGARLQVLNHFFERLPAQDPAPSALTAAVRCIFETQGLMPISELCSRADTGERQLERLFKRYIGLTPKFYSRIIRFSAIFRRAQEPHTTLSDLSAHSGYYDQPHFNRNFKAFTGEDPSRYGFGEHNIANFFLRRS